VVDQSKETLAQLTEKAKQPDADSTEINRQMAQLQTTLALANERKTQYENNLAKAEMIRKQGTMLNEYISTIRKTRVLKQASFWQQVLNYVFYTIFIMNAFITGFGLDSSQTAPVGVDVVVPNGTAAGVQS
jgi:DNA repair exonuclease SbcCD ATPase subunit